jgi:hypothetical protein
MFQEEPDLSSFVVDTFNASLFVADPVWIIYVFLIILCGSDRLVDHIRSHSSDVQRVDWFIDRVLELVNNFFNGHEALGVGCKTASDLSVNNLCMLVECARQTWNTYNRRRVGHF